MEKSQSLSLLVSLVLISFLASTNATYNVVDFGAKADGKTDSTRAFLAAWASTCGSTRPTNIYVPHGRYLIKRVIFKGPCKTSTIQFHIDGTLVAPSNYWEVGNFGHWISFYKVSGVSISGGTLDGQGAGFWSCRAGGKKCPDGARSLTFNHARDIVVQGLTSINSQVSHIALNNCKNVMVQSLKIIAPDDSPNTDGIHIQRSMGVIIKDTNIKTGDDCISIGPGTTNLWIEHIDCGPGHGISIGSLARHAVEEGVQNVTVKRVVFTGSDNGLRIKSWARPSNGFVRGILYQNIIMKNVRNPIIIDQHYCPHKIGCPGQESGIKISQVTYQNVQGSSTTQIATKFDCSATNPCRDIKLHDIKLTYNNYPAKSSCLNAKGKTSGFVSPASCL